MELGSRHATSPQLGDPEVARGWSDDPLIKNLVRLTNELQQERGRGLIFVGYSYGGLLVKQVCIRLYILFWMDLIPS
jgi:hypothetical protein